MFELKNAIYTDIYTKPKKNCVEIPANAAILYCNPVINLILKIDRYVFIFYSPYIVLLLYYQ